MKLKMIIYFFVGFAMLFSVAANADDDWGRYGHHGWGHHHHHHHGWGPPPQQINNYYYPQPPRPAYYPRPPVVYYPRPPVAYYPAQPQYYGGGYGGRSHQGLAGGVIGTVFGYELGNGDPLAAGLGAAAGSFLGNGVGWRY